MPVDSEIQNFKRNQHIHLKGAMAHMGQKITWNILLVDQQRVANV